MTTDQWKLLRWLGLAVAAIGVAVGLWSVQVPALNMAENCGSAWQASDYATNGSGSLIVAECDTARNSRLMWSLILLGVGLAGAGAAQNAVSPWFWMVGSSPHVPSPEGESAETVPTP